MDERAEYAPKLAKTSPFMRRPARISSGSLGLYLIALRAYFPVLPYIFVGSCVIYVARYMLPNLSDLDFVVQFGLRMVTWMFVLTVFLRQILGDLGYGIVVAPFTRWPRKYWLGLVLALFVFASAVATYIALLWLAHFLYFSAQQEFWWATIFFFAFAGFTVASSLSLPAAALGRDEPIRTSFRIAKRAAWPVFWRLTVGPVLFLILHAGLLFDAFALFPFYALVDESGLRWRAAWFLGSCIGFFGVALFAAVPSIVYSQIFPVVEDDQALIDTF